MTTLRRRVRLWATVWLIFQAASLSAFVPRDCCAAHRPVAAKQTCHETPPQAHCPMRDAQGEPCPMHRTPPTAHDAHAAHTTPEAPADAGAPADRCVLRGACQGATFVSVLSYPGILTDPTPVAVRMAVRAPSTGLSEHPVTRRHAPDPRPPRV